jgi:hypothetical protein
MKNTSGRKYGGRDEGEADFQFRIWIYGEGGNVLERLAEKHGQLRHLHGYLCTGHRREDANI